MRASLDELSVLSVPITTQTRHHVLTLAHSQVKSHVSRFSLSIDQTATNPTHQKHYKSKMAGSHLGARPGEGVC